MRKVYDVMLNNFTRCASFDEKLWGKEALSAAEKYIKMMKEGQNGKGGKANCAEMKWSISQHEVADDALTPRS